MAKKKTAVPHARGPELSALALLLLRSMAEVPSRIEYNTRVLGGSFKEPDVARLDAAYKELEQQQLIERSGQVVSFFGSPKTLFRITKKGVERTGGKAA